MAARRRSGPREAPARPASEDLLLEVRVQPRSGREGVDGTIAGRIRVRVRAAPVDGSANRRLTELLAREFGVPRSDVQVVAGASRRDKRVQVHAPRRRPDWLQG